MKETYAPSWEEVPEGEISPQQVIQRIGALAPEDSVFVTGVGQHQMWASHFLPHDKPRSWLTSGGAGTMGYCVPAALGANGGRIISPSGPVLRPGSLGCQGRAS